MECFKCHTPLPDNSRFCLSCGADVSGEGHERTIAADASVELMNQLQAELGTEYILDHEIGRGGMAVVYLGRDAHLGRKVAVKVLPPELTFGAGPGIIERFKREARTSATLDHPNIIPVYRVSQGGKLFWYVMKYLDGESLDRVLQREGQLALDRTGDIIRQVAEGLDFAHHNQVIHRDVKPANVVVDSRGRVTVTDFGIAKALDANALTGSGAMIGTPYYMSPEQCAGKKVGPASDQYSLAVMTYQMIGGHLPFTGESVIDIVRKHVMDPVPPLGVLRPNLPEAVVRVVERGLAKHAEDRFASCGDYARTFVQAAQGLEVSLAPPAGPSTSGERLSHTAMVSPIPVTRKSTTGPGSMAKARPARRRIPWAVLGLVLVSTGAGVAIWRSMQLPVEPLRQAPPQQAAVPPAAMPAPADSTPVTVPETTRVATPAATPPPAATSQARLNVSAKPRTAQVSLNGQPVRRRSVTLRPGTRYVLEATARGYRAYADTFVAEAGRTYDKPIVLTSDSTAAPNPPVAVPPADSFGYLTVGTRQGAQISVNGTPTGQTRLRSYKVRAGPVRLSFTMDDSTGSVIRYADTVVVVIGGQINAINALDLRPLR